MNGLKSILLVMLFGLCLFFISGCAAVKDHKTELRITTNLAINHLNYEYQKELSKCPDIQECHEAEKIATYIDYANRLLVYLECEDFNADTVISILDSIIEVLEQEGKDEIALYAKDIRTILIAIKEENEKKAAGNAQ